jgi:FkbM family methyltransferase
MIHLTFRFLMGLYRLLFARRCFYPINRFLFNLSLRGIGILNEERGGCSHTGEESLLRRITPQWQTHPTILDVGAHTGLYANTVKRLAPQACLYAFEPHPKTFVELKQQADIHGYMALNVGCGDQECTAPLYDYRTHDGTPHATIHRGVIETLHKGQSDEISVDIITLDAFIRKQEITRVDLLKIDTEGNELKILGGLKSSIDRKMVDVIQFEFNAMNVISRAFLRDFHLLLSHYQFFRLLPDGPVALGEYSPIFWELFAFQNIVAVRQDCGIRI